MNSNDFLCGGVNFFQYLLAIVQTEQALRVISLAFSILSTLIITTFKVIEWYRRSKKDGKIDKEEIQELKNIAEDAIIEIKNNKENEQK